MGRSFQAGGNGQGGEAHVAVTGSEDSGLAATQIAWDGIGILVHLSNFTKEVTKEQVADIYSGKVKEWSELGGPETKILLIDRPKNQNIRDAFERQLGIDGKIRIMPKSLRRTTKSSRPWSARFLPCLPWPISR